MAADIDSVVTYVQAQLAEIKKVASDARDDLSALAQGHLNFFSYNPIPDYEPNTGYTPQDISLGEVVPFAKPVLNVAVYKDLEPVAVEDFEAPVISGTFAPQDFDPTAISGEIEALATKVLDFIDNGGPGISTEVQTAIADNMRERDLQLVADSILSVAVSDALSGFPFPTSMTMAAKNEIIKKYQDDRSNRNREIVMLMTDRAHQTAMKGIDAGISLTQIKSNLQAEIWRLYYSMQGLILEEFRTKVAAAVSVYETEIRKVLADYDLLRVRALTEQGINLEQFKVEAMGEEIRVRSDVQLALSSAEIGLRSNDHSYGTMLKEAELQLTKWVENVRSLTDRGKADISQLADLNLRRVDAAKSQADYYKGITTGLANMVNTIQTKKS